MASVFVLTYFGMVSKRDGRNVFMRSVFNFCNGCVSPMLGLDDIVFV